MARYVHFYSRALRESSPQYAVLRYIGRACFHGRCSSNGNRACKTVQTKLVPTNHANPVSTSQPLAGLHPCS
jgi:hypothetical protein